MSSDPRLPDPRMIPHSQARSWFDPVVDAPQLPASTAADDSFIRPFIVTGGRTRPLHDGLRLDTMIRALPAALSAPLAFESRQIVVLCQHARSLAEIAGTLGIPVGVARVLTADLITANLVSFQESAELPVAVIERIRDLVRAL